MKQEVRSMLGKGIIDQISPAERKHEFLTVIFAFFRFEVNCRENSDCLL